MFRPFAERNDEFIEVYEGFTAQLMSDSSTGHMHFDPMPTDQLLNHYYNGTFTRSEDEPNAEKEFTPQVLEAIRGLKGYLLETGGLTEEFSFHDVGCGYGAAVWAMRQFRVRATGNEANQKWVESANKHCEGKLSAAPLDQVLSALPYKIDAFFCAHVLEHVANPLAELRLMAKYMSDEGVAYLCMPNIHSLRTIRRGVRDSAAYFFPMHLNYFTPKSLLAMVRDAGLEPAQIETRSMFDDEATATDCENLRGWELFMLAVKPGNSRAKRQGDIDLKCERAFRHFNEALPSSCPSQKIRPRLMC